MACCEENNFFDFMTWGKKSCMMMWAYSQSRYPKGRLKKKRTTKDYF
jgi:hypothetical protein